MESQGRKTGSCVFLRSWQLRSQLRICLDCLEASATPANARAIAFSVQARTEMRRKPPATLDPGATPSAYQASPMMSYTSTALKPDVSAKIQSAAEIPIETEFGTVYVELAEPVIEFAHRLSHAENQQTAAAALLQVESQLDDWQVSRRAATGEAGKIVLPFGVELRLPQEF